MCAESSANLAKGWVKVSRLHRHQVFRVCATENAMGTAPARIQASCSAPNPERQSVAPSRPAARALRADDEKFSPSFDECGQHLDEAAVGPV